MADYSVPVYGCGSRVLDPPSGNDEDCQTLVLWITSSSSTDKQEFLPYVNDDDIKFTAPDTSILGEELENTIQSFDPNDITYMTFDPTSKTESIKLGPNKLVKVNTSIRDVSQKWFVLQNGKLFTRSLQGANNNNKDKFTVTVYKPNGAPTATLKVKDKDLFLAYESGKLHLKQMTEEDLNKPDIDTTMFYFYIRNTGNTTFSFNPVAAPDYFICSSQQDNVPATVQPQSVNSFIKEFMFESGFGGEVNTEALDRTQGLVIVIKWCRQDDQAIQE
ncbi:interleukin-1 receptor antagonist protein-like [Discoglossus pictus]